MNYSTLLLAKFLTANLEVYQQLNGRNILV